VLRYGGGATGALMIVSGFMFGGLVVQDAFARRSAAPVLRVILGLLPQVFVLSLLVWLVRSYGRPAELYILTLTADMQDYSPGGARHDEIYLWYVHGLLHMMMMVYLALLVVQRVGWFDIGRRRFLMLLFAAGCVGRFVLPGLLDPSVYATGVAKDATVHFLPTTHLATLALGGLITTCTTSRERFQLIVVLAFYAVASAWLFGWTQLIFVGGGGLLLLALPRIRVPRLSAPAVFGLAGASLWIYMTHMVVQDAVNSAAPQVGPLAGVALALAVGIGLWMAWVRAASWLAGRLFKRSSPVAVDAVV
jgi:hypothetical protein